MKEILEKLLAKENLTHMEMWDIFNKMMQGGLSEAQIAAFLTALRAKGESLDEISVAAEILREVSDGFDLKDEHVIDTCGTGGSKYKMFNVSTTVAFVVAAAGGKVAKHGNRSNSGRSGSSDLLEALGVDIQMTKEDTKKSIEENGVGFMFAPLYHPAMKYVVPVRKDLGIRTIFNLIGPLANPAKVKRQIVGVYGEEMIETYAYALQKLGHIKAIVVYGEGGLDEFSLFSASKYAVLEDGEIKVHEVSPEDVGLTSSTPEELQGGSPEENAKICEAILKGEDAGPKSDLVAFNAGAALFVADLASSLKEGVEKAKEVLQSGKAYEKLESLRSK